MQRAIWVEQIQIEKSQLCTVDYKLYFTVADIIFLEMAKRSQFFTANADNFKKKSTILQQMIASIFT